MTIVLEFQGWWDLALLILFIALSVLYFQMRRAAIRAARAARELLTVFQHDREERARAVSALSAQSAEPGRGRGCADNADSAETNAVAAATPAQYWQPPTTPEQRKGGSE